MKKLLPLYTKLALIFTNTLLLFILLNVVAYYMLTIKYDHYLISPKVMLETNPALMQKIHAGKSIADISELYFKTPNIKSHPVLEFMTKPFSSRFYHIGFENCRYNSFITPSNIEQRINQGTWLLGGSTTFGFGVADDETIAYFLNTLDTTNHYINFGVLGYHQKQEIDKLILLLRKGYRPSRVIFLDGLNDLSQLTASNFEPSETPSKPFNAYAQDFSIANLNVNRNTPYIFPIVRLCYLYAARFMMKNGESNSESPDNIYDEKNLYNTRPYMHYKISELYEPKPDSILLHKADNYYKENMVILDALSKAFHFEYTIFFQPIGMMFDGNYFCVNPAVFQTNFKAYHALKSIYHHIKHGIKNNKFPHFYDLSMTDRLCQYPYVDLTHYSKSMNQLMARQILAHQHTDSANRLLTENAYSTLKKNNRLRRQH